MDDREAITRCLAGDKEAFGHLVRRYQAQVMALCLRLSGNREDAADAAQQAFVQAFRHLGQYDKNQPFRPWLMRIAANECISLFRRKKHQAHMVDEQIDAAILHDEPDLHTRVHLAEDRERVRQAVNELPDAYRTVVVLYYFMERSYLEIHRQTGLPMGTIGTHLHRAKQMLRRVLVNAEVSTGDLVMPQT